VEDLSSERREATKAARVKLRLEIAKRKELLARPLNELFTELLEAVADLGPVGLSQKLKASMEEVLHNQFRGLVSTDPGQVESFQMDSCLRDTVAALSLAKELDGLALLPDAGGAVLAGDRVLFGVLVEKLINLASAIPAHQGRLTLSSGFLNLDGERACFLEAAQSGVSESLVSEVFSGPGEVHGLQQLAESFAGKVSSFHEPTRGTTIRVLFPQEPVEKD
jgi:hypothetical protein